jgi:hypothetical protein
MKMMRERWMSRRIGRSSIIVELDRQPVERRPARS